MGFLLELALFSTFLIGIYALLHDFLGLDIISYVFFENYLAPLFTASSITFLIGFLSLFYWRKNKDNYKKNKKAFTLTLSIFALGVFLTAIPMEVTITFNLVVGKLLILTSLVLGYLIVTDKFQIKA